MLPQAGIIVLGDNDSGKTSLIARLQKNDDPKKGAGLEYHYMEVNPDYRDGRELFFMETSNNVVNNAVLRNLRLPTR